MASYTFIFFTTSDSGPRGWGGGWIVHCLRTLAALPEDLPLISSTHMQPTTVYNPSSRRPDAF